MSKTTKNNITRAKELQYNIGLLDKKVFQLPKRRDNDYFPEYLKEIFSNYEDVLPEFIGETSNRLVKEDKRIKNLIRSLRESVRYFYEGFPKRAYDELSTAIKSIEDTLPVSPRSMIYMSKQTNLYRIRSVKGNYPLKKEDIFHVPYEKRDLVQSQRYSIPGMPCLYLGNSIFLCWEELNRPDFDNCYISRFRLNEDFIRLMDFAYPTKLFKKYLENDLKDENIFDHEIRDTLISYLVKWPLIASCSIKLRCPNYAFKPEYIVPQMVLEWVRQNKNLDGIIYFSTKINNETEEALGFYCNYAIPIKSVKKKGHCPTLIERIELTTPTSSKILNLLNQDFNLVRCNKVYFHNIENIEFNLGEPIEYCSTKFGRMEQYLCTELELGKLKSTPDKISGNL